MRRCGLQKKRMLAMAAVPLMLGGCSLLPAEETGGHVALVQTVAQADHELAQVTRENVELTKTIYCTYLQTQEESLSFHVSGRRVQYVYVSVGDRVQKGDLLVKMETDDLDAELKDLRYTIDKNTLLLAQTEELKAFDLAELKKRYDRGELTRSQYEGQAEQIEAGYEGTINNYKDTLYIAQLRREKLEDELAGCTLYAGMDGMVSYLFPKMQNSYPGEGVEMIKIIDNTQCMFRMDDMNYADYFIDGQEIVLTNNNSTQYTAKVMPSAEAPDTEHIYLALLEPDATLAVGTRAYVTLLLDARENVLALPVSVLHHADEQAYVYCEDEDGLKSVRYITTGLVGTKYVEILNGLEEGELVIRR